MPQNKPRGADFPHTGCGLIGTAVRENRPYAATRWAVFPLTSFSEKWSISTLTLGGHRRKQPRAVCPMPWQPKKGNGQSCRKQPWVYFASKKGKATDHGRRSSSKQSTMGLGGHRRKQPRAVCVPDALAPDGNQKRQSWFRGSILQQKRARQRIMDVLQAGKQATMGLGTRWLQNRQGSPVTGGRPVGDRGTRRQQSRQGTDRGQQDSRKEPWLCLGTRSRAARFRRFCT